MSEDKKRCLFDEYQSHVQKLVDDGSGRGEFADRSDILEELQQLWIDYIQDLAWLERQK